MARARRTLRDPETSEVIRLWLPGSQHSELALRRSIPIHVFRSRSCSECLPNLSTLYNAPHRPDNALACP